MGEEPKFEAVQDSLKLATEIKDNGVYLSWSVYNKDDFKSYKIVRSENNNDLKFPQDGAIKSSNDKEFNSFLDSTVSDKINYNYRICAVKISDNVACGNVATVEFKKQDTTAPNQPHLSATISTLGLYLTWTANTDDDFKEYRVLKSISDPKVTYPSIGYLAINNKGSESYLDKEVNITSAGHVYYRICSLDMDGNYSCSNVVTVENGQVK